MISFTLLIAFEVAAAAPCNSLMTCAPACEKNDAQACVWMVQNHRSGGNGLQYAARACAVDEKTCDILAREILMTRPTNAGEVNDAVKRIAPACDRGDVEACDAILDATTKYGEAARPELVPLAKKAAQKICAEKQPKPCEPNQSYCTQGWNDILATCENAAKALQMPALADVAMPRALSDCRKSSSACTDILDELLQRVSKAPSLAERQARNKLFVEIAERVVDECKKPGDRACEMLGWGGRFEDSPSLAKKIAQKKCAVEGGQACSEQARHECNGGKGPLTACIDSVLAGGARYDDDVDAVEKKITEACIKDDKRACFAVGITNAGLSSYRLRTALIEGDEAFQRGCKLGHAPSCRASKRPAVIKKPAAPPKDALRPSETEAVHVRVKGDGAPLSRRVLVEQWSWYGDEEEPDEGGGFLRSRSGREVYELSELPALAGLREGADVVVWDDRRREVKRYVAVVNVTP